MLELGFVIYLLAFGYALGIMWYHLFDYRVGDWMRIIAFPFLGVVIGEGLWVPNMASGPAFFGVHVFVAISASLIAVLVDMGIHLARTRTVHEVRPAHA